MQVVSLAASNRNPLADPLEFLKSNGPIRVLRSLNKLLADNVVGIAGKPPFFTGQFFKPPFGRAGALSLEFFSQPPVAVTNIASSLPAFSSNRA